MVPELHGCDGGVIGGLVADHGTAAVAGGGAGGAPGLDAALSGGNSITAGQWRNFANVR